MLSLHALAALAAVVGPRLLGSMVQSVRDGTTTEHVDRLAMLLAVSLIAQTVLTFVARRASFVLGETVFAELREGFLERVLRLPLSTVERAGTGDLVTRSTGDIEALARTVRFAVPEVLVAIVTVLADGRRGVLHRPARGAADAARHATDLSSERSAICGSRLAATCASARAMRPTTVRWRRRSRGPARSRR